MTKPSPGESRNKGIRGSQGEFRRGREEGRPGKEGKQEREKGRGSEGQEDEGAEKERCRA